MSAQPEMTGTGHDHPGHDSGRPTDTTTLHVGGMYRGSEHLVVQAALARVPGVVSVEANPIAQTATVTYDPELTSVEELRELVEECGFHCAGRSVPCELCDPHAENEPLAPAHDHAATIGAHDLAPRDDVAGANPQRRAWRPEAEPLQRAQAPDDEPGDSERPCAELRANVVDVAE